MINIKFIIFVTILNVLGFNAFADFVHPMGFDGSKVQRDGVIRVIKDQVKKSYCDEVDICNHSFLRRMEQKELESFKLLTTAKNRFIMDNIIKSYCIDINYCSYAIIWMTYKREIRDSKKSLQW